MNWLDLNTLAMLKGMVGGFFFLLFTHRPKNKVWDWAEIIRFSRRVGIGLTMATLGTELVQKFYPGTPTAPAAAVLMAFGMEIVDRYVRPKVEGPKLEKKNG